MIGGQTVENSEAMGPKVCPHCDHHAAHHREPEGDEQVWVCAVANCVCTHNPYGVAIKPVICTVIQFNNELDTKVHSIENFRGREFPRTALCGVESIDGFVFAHEDESAGRVGCIKCKAEILLRTDNGNAAMALHVADAHRSLLLAAASTEFQSKRSQLLGFAAAIKGAADSWAS